MGNTYSYGTPTYTPADDNKLNDFTLNEDNAPLYDTRILGPNMIRRCTSAESSYPITNDIVPPPFPFLGVNNSITSNPMTNFIQTNTGFDRPTNNKRKRVNIDDEENPKKKRKNSMNWILHRNI